MSCATERIKPFFLPVDAGNRFCLLTSPPDDVSVRGAILFVHAFAEEMNKSRRVVAIQSRALANAGYAVMQIDLCGCGDSSGELRDATLSVWRADLDAGARWLHERGFQPITVWGMRLGALIAAHWATRSSVRLQRLLLWNPVASGKAHINQFLRIGLVSGVLATGSSRPAQVDLRTLLGRGETVEVAGYDLNPQLVREIDELALADIAPLDAPVEWFEVGSRAELPPASRRVLDAWTKNGISAREHCIAGDSFWATVELTDCPQLIDATTAVMTT